MDDVEFVAFMREAILTVLIVGAPIVLAVTVVGVLISWFQALTQIQEMTLSFIPKLLLLLAMIALSLPFAGAKLAAFTDLVFDRIAMG